jgi:triosephosphate isomerase
MNDTKRRPLVGGNWKMHMLRQPAQDFCNGLVGGLGSERAEIVLFPSFPLIHMVAMALEGSAAAVGGQDLHTADQGAHTGDVSGPQLADAGCQWALCGHSERRADHDETDTLVGEKAVAATRHNLYPLICLGETLEERQSGRTFEVLERQLNAGLAGRPEPFALAYEPVWAIGTGETATPEIAQEAHGFLRERLAALSMEAPPTPKTPRHCSPSPTSTGSWWAAQALTRRNSWLSFAAAADSRRVGSVKRGSHS